MKEAIITFLKTDVHDDFDPDIDIDLDLNLGLDKKNDQTFSLFYSKIIEAENFCKREGLEHCFVGYKALSWVIKTSNKNLTCPVKVTPNGIDAQGKYIYIICDIKDVLHSSR